MIRNGLLYLPLFLLCLQAFFVTVFGDFRVLDKWTNKVVFQTSSDFVRTGCGSLKEKSYLIASDPLNACDVPSAPPAPYLLSNYISYVFGDNQERREYQYVLYAEDGGCDIKTKFRNAANAGYSGIIVGTDERHEEIIHPGLLSEDDEEFIDVHLVHSLDIRVISKWFRKYEDFVLEPPNLSRCREEYKRTWLRSQYVSLVIRTWKRIMDATWQYIQWMLLMLGKVVKGLKLVFYTPDTFSSIAISLGCLVISITVMMMISIHNNAKKLLKYRSFQKHKMSFTEPQKPQQTKPEEHQQRCPPKPDRQTTTASVDYTIRHRVNLNISLNEKLTRAKVNIAYRDMALKYHPDKNVHLDETQRARITEEFMSKKKSREILLLYCTE